MGAYFNLIQDTQSFNQNNFVIFLFFMLLIVSSGSMYVFVTGDINFNFNFAYAMLSSRSQGLSCEVKDQSADHICDSVQTFGVLTEQTINDVRRSRLVLLEGITNAIVRLQDSEPSTSIENPTAAGSSFNFNTTHIAQLLKTDQLEEAIVELNNLQAQVIKVFGQSEANKQVVPQIQNLIVALEKQGSST
jgi:hypothetical protein